MTATATDALRICLAPLRGVTDAIFRTCYAAHFSGIDWAVTPFLSTTKGPRIKPSYLKEVLPENNTGMPVIPQIMSKSADDFLLLSAALQDLGYTTINWNLGCPYPMVANKGRGSGLLPHPETIKAFLERVMAFLPGRLSIKLRLGRHHHAEIDALIPIFNGFPLKEIIIHPRTGVQMYEGLPDLATFGRCLEAIRHPVIYNGDITCQRDFGILHTRFPKVNAWMLGRGVVSDPFLAGRIKGQGSVQEDNETFRRFHNDLYRRYSRKLHGPSHLLNRMKGLWGYFAKAFKDGEKLRKSINKTQNPKHFEAVVEHFLDENPERRRNEPKFVSTTD